MPLHYHQRPLSHSSQNLDQNLSLDCFDFDLFWRLWFNVHNLFAWDLVLKRFVNLIFVLCLADFAFRSM
ncbi:hypothetical protein QVD17_01621 [Tagetes erecta]|uniref:Uncharacterized protein n=1 Tax=Tagetes erecta TaxID=13708 RepID=A0AAD8LDZ2_TARER|nr:hypothetical protein QVD17_01621 [Tagetes erecta]